MHAHPQSMLKMLSPTPTKLSPATTPEQSTTQNLSVQVLATRPTM